MRSELTARLGENVPRYTSYPTAPHFHAGVTSDTVRDWLRAVPQGERVSLYLHIPYCDRLCWFCACHTKQTHRYEPVFTYLKSLHREIGMVGALIEGRTEIGAVHFGGGSPTLLKPADLIALMDSLRSAFNFSPDTSISLEIDPNDMDSGRLDAPAAIGLTRASLGIQDFDPRVQRAINREQSFEDTKAVVDGLRERGVGSVNLDVLYGLPHQTTDSVASTIEQVLSLKPDRIALFGYAHVPWFKKHQTMIDEAWLPDAQARLAQSRLAGERIRAAGYNAIGLDHFALPRDSLAIAAKTGKLRRNFQGYTDDRCETLIGLGPSSISQYRQGYAQNITATGEYERIVTGGRLATVRGIAFDDEDRLRGWVIERLMCDFAFSPHEALERFGKAALPVVEEASALARTASNRLLERRGDLFVVPERERPFVRTIASRFDRYFAVGQARHSAAV